MSCVQPREAPLNFFLDRSLGRIAVPNGLRAAGLQVVTLAERYGVPTDQFVKDEVWLKDAGVLGDIVLMKDRRIRYRSVEREALVRNNVRAFCLSNGNLNSQEMIDAFVNNVDRMTRACGRLGPFIYIVHSRSIEELTF